MKRIPSGRLTSVRAGAPLCSGLRTQSGSRCGSSHLQDRIIPMERGKRGYHHATVGGIAPGALYLYRLDGDLERPDPASRHQPQGVHGPSCVTDPRFDWSDDNWTGLALSDYILYELHVGTFTAEGTFDAAVIAFGRPAGAGGDGTGADARRPVPGVEKLGL